MDFNEVYSHHNIFNNNNPYHRMKEDLCGILQSGANRPSINKKVTKFTY